MNYNEAKEMKQELNNKVEELSNVLKKFESIDSGMVLETVRDTFEFKEAKRNFDLYFSKLQAFNAYFLKTFKKEYAKDRKNRFNKK